MAVIDESPGLEVQIHVNGKPLHEYDDRHSEVPGKTSESYIEAQSDVNFEIHYSFKAPFPAGRPVSMIVTIDGKDVDEPFIRANELYNPQGHVSAGAISNDGEKWGLQKYYFAPIRIRECTFAPIPEDLKKKLQPVGIITCELYFLDNAQRNQQIRFARKELEKLETVNEKAIKGESLSHQAILGDTEPTEEIEYFNADYADGGEPFATFHFYYRSLDALKDLHIIERTPDPVDLLNGDDSVLGQLNREQLEAIVRRFREQEETRMRMKRERSDSVSTVRNDDDCDPDFIETDFVDLRQKRKMARLAQLPGDGVEVISL
ncbi:hypothetical protein EJ02DRAFT_458833, partial [Clathrospora elynae]